MAQNYIQKRTFTEAFVSFLHHETFSGVFLLACALLAMVIANSPLAHYYFELWEMPVGLSVGGHFIGFSLHHVINDVLMALFFLVVGLEIKREVLFGALCGFAKAAFPVVGALGGMMAPGLIYSLFNAGTPSISGFGIPMATDIAFALGAMLLLGRRVPVALKVFLVTLAVADDLGAIIVIALFYPSAEGLSLAWLGGAAAVVIALIALNKCGVRALKAYLALGVLLWVCVHFSGIHATISAVILAFTIPVRPQENGERYDEIVGALSKKFAVSNKQRKSALLNDEQVEALEGIIKLSTISHNPNLRLEHALAPLSTYFIMPLFAFANAGVALGGEFNFGIDHIFLGVFFGLVVGKPVGITLLTFLAEKVGFAARPSGVSWAHIFGAGMLGGIGFTMSIFVSNLAFTSAASIDLAKVSILLASFTAGVLGSVYLIALGKRNARSRMHESEKLGDTHEEIVANHATFEAHFSAQQATLEAQEMAEMAEAKAAAAKAEKNCENSAATTPNSNLSRAGGQNASEIANKNDKTRAKNGENLDEK